MNTFNLKDHELTVGEVHHNLPPSSLYEHAIRYEKESSIAENDEINPIRIGWMVDDRRVELDG